MKTWITVSATEVQTGDVTDIGRVSSVESSYTDSLGWVKVHHDGARPSMFKADEIVEVYR